MSTSIEYRAAVRGCSILTVIWDDYVQPLLKAALKKEKK